MSFLTVNDPKYNEFAVEYFKLARANIKKHVDKHYLQIKYGEQDPKEYKKLSNADLANNFFYLFALLTIAYYEYASNDQNVTETEYREFYTNYQMECIKKNFLCWGSDISELLELFSLIRSDLDGIGYMFIDGEGVVDSGNPFIIT